MPSRSLHDGWTLPPDRSYAFSRPRRLFVLTSTTALSGTSERPVGRGQHGWGILVSWFEVENGLGMVDDCLPVQL